MSEYVNEIIGKLRLFMNDKINIHELTGWAEKKYNFFFERGDYKILNNRLINDILLEIRDLVEEISVEDVISKAENIYFKDQISAILELLLGKENYFEVYKIREICSDKYQPLCKVLDKLISLIICNKLIPKEELVKIKDYLLKENQITKEDIIISEIILTLFHLNEAIRVNSEEVFIGMLGNCKSGINVKEEKEYLMKLSEILHGKRAYRLSLGLNSTSIIYTNIVILE
ncbi:hypothetical protein [Oceanirhabdus sp. W0125-5]|uniref:hypothetical protein n=1 Tax=Oceanirhabdus sp. W0125-5 TaxID=2999116 RepID=UPI0022F2E9CD|nr:hypothetical protein [Oceanirhabdus sp. W0125-5]WBW97423.1 hypothetical protein OW730_00785 [Oceanirhabdus sp. W0125-5]